MFSGKLRSWMEAVRPKKKQHRKDKHSKLQQQQLQLQQQQEQHQQQQLPYKYGSHGVDDTGRQHHHYPLGMRAVSTSASSELEMLDRYHSQNACSKSTETVATAATVATTGTSASAELSGSDRPHSGGYASGANLSSPESAYSTGYSTDCTSPGTALPDYYIRSNANTHGQNHVIGYPSNVSAVSTVVYTSVLKNGHTAAAQLPTHLERVSVVTAAIPKSPRLVQNKQSLSPKTVERSSSATAVPVGQHQQHSRHKSITLHEYDVADTSHRFSIPAPVPSVVSISGPSPSANGGASATGGSNTCNTAAAAASAAVTSPRQRNRIRTNPWLGAATPVPPCSLGGTGHAVHSPGPYVKNNGKGTTGGNSPFSGRHNLKSTALCYSPVARLAGTIRNGGGVAIESLSTSSSCSSLSANSLQWDAASVIGSSSRSCGTRRRNKPLHHHSAKINENQHPSKRSIHTDEDEEEDCTLNEMMGKYDESYVYEKETDILSDSDPTDCDEDGDDDETDLDTGQEAGDELDFIDNGSYLEFNMQEQQKINTQHCTYYNFETQRKMSCSSKKRHSSRRGKNETHSTTGIAGSRRSVKKRPITCQSDQMHFMERNSRSAGTTPLSIRKVKKSAAIVAASTIIVQGSTGNEQYYRKRSSSVSATARVPLSAFDQRDKEADKKYRELIVEAEHILMNMKTTNMNPPTMNAVLSPVRRLPGPANKRVELLRTECAKQETYHLKTRPAGEEQIILTCPNNATATTTNTTMIPSKIPVRFGGPNGCSPRFSPKRNHITNFMNNNSPILLNSSTDRNTDRSYILDVTQGPRRSPLSLRKEQHGTLSPMLTHRKGSSSPARRSPKYTRKVVIPKGKARGYNNKSDSTDSETEGDNFLRKCNDAHSNCPQSEPVKRKVYASTNVYQGGKTVGFNLQYDVIDNSARTNPNSSCENLRQEALLNTITSLKRSLVDQSTSLKELYRSSHTLQS